MDYFKLYANCKITRGVKRSLISDLQRFKSDFIPNDMIYVVDELHKKETVDNIKNKFGQENKSIIESYLNFLINNEYGLLLSKDAFDAFPDIDNTYEYYGKITNAILEISSEKNLNNYGKFIEELSQMGCKSIFFVFYDSLSINAYKDLSQLIYNTKINSIQLLSKYHDGINRKNFQKINESLEFIVKHVFHSSPENKIIQFNKAHHFEVEYTKIKMKDFRFCGVVSKRFFGINLNKFVEAQSHNSCLNQKISIDVDGNIKNCPSMPNSYGNINDTTLEEAINKPRFKQYWNVTKDEIAVCRDCEFRHVCTDCRAYTERSEVDIEGLDLSKPLKCGYNPYTNEWTEWSTNPLKKTAIDYYDMQELIK